MNRRDFIGGCVAAILIPEQPKPATTTYMLEWIDEDGEAIFTDTISPKLINWSGPWPEMWPRES